MTIALKTPTSLPPSAFPPTTAPHCSPQIIENRYIDDDKLLEICKERFGKGNYKLRVSCACNKDRCQGWMDG